MQEYFDSGLKLRWLINPQQQQVEIYRPSCFEEVLQLPVILAGEDVLPGFVLKLSMF